MITFFNRSIGLGKEIAIILIIKLIILFSIWFCFVHNHTVKVTSERVQHDFFEMPLWT